VKAREVIVVVYQNERQKGRRKEEENTDIKGKEKVAQKT
jgi:hypothetical protein